jgi:hypothetical protein
MASARGQCTLKPAFPTRFFKSGFLFQICAVVEIRRSADEGAGRSSIYHLCRPHDSSDRRIQDTGYFDEGAISALKSSQLIAADVLVVDKVRFLKLNFFEARSATDAAKDYPAFPGL